MADVLDGIGALSQSRSRNAAMANVCSLSSQILGWAGYIKVDGVAYNFLGAPTVAGAQKAVQKSLQVN